MKSEVFKSAWAIFKIENISFSEALKQAWKSVKEGFRKVILRMNKLVKSETWFGFETVYYNALNTIKIHNEAKSYNYGKGVEAWYDGKTFNND